MGPYRSVDHSGRSILSRSTYDGGLKRSFGPRDRDGIPYAVGSRRQFSSTERSHDRRSPGKLFLIIAVTVMEFPLSCLHSPFCFRLIPVWFFGQSQLMGRLSQRGTTFGKMNFCLGHLVLLENLLTDTLIKKHMLHVNLCTCKVPQGVFLVLVLIDHLLIMMIMVMKDIWSDPQTIVKFIFGITMLFPAQNVPILQWSVVLLIIFIYM